MTSPSHAAPDRSPAAGEETAGRSPRKRVTVITATALSLLEACGLGPSPSRPDKTAGKEGRAPQGDAPAGKVPADHPQARQAEEPASSRRRSGGRKTASAPDSGGQAAGGRGAADRCRRQRRGPGGPSGDPVRTGHAARTCRLPEKKRCPSSPCGQPGGCACDRRPDSSPARSRRAGRHTGSGPCGWPAFRGCGGSRSGCGTDGGCRRAGVCLPCAPFVRIRRTRPQEGCRDAPRICRGNSVGSGAGGGAGPRASPGCGGTDCRGGPSGGGIRSVVIGRRAGGAARG